MTKKSRRDSEACLRIPQLPCEIKALIVEELGLERDLVTLRSLQSACSAFSVLTRREIYKHVDFRRKSREAVALFAQHVAPKYGDLVLSVTHRPVDEDQISLIPSTAVRLEELRNWDRTYASALRSLSKINTIDLTIPTLEFHSMYGESIDIIMRWKAIQHLTLRAAGWGRGDFISSTDAFNARTVGTMLSQFDGLESFRALGVSGLDISPDGPSLVSLKAIPALKFSSLHLAGGWLHEFTPHFARLSPPLTHLVISEDTEIDYSELADLILAVSPTLESLALRQAGAITIEDTDAPFSPSALPRLKRLVLSLDGEIALPLSKFVNVDLRTLEIGTSDELYAGQLAKLLQGGVWSRLESLAYVAPGVEAADWEAMYEECSKRGIPLLPGFTTEEDFPVRL